MPLTTWIGRRSRKQAAVLGCGPAGLFAVHALTQAGGWDIKVFSKYRRSEMFGAQFLQQPIIGLDGSDEPSKVDYQVWGTAEEYAAKVYGSSPKKLPFVSVDRLKGVQPAWDIRRAYYDAWRRYSQFVVPADEITGEDVNSAVRSHDYDLIVSTIPLTSICINPGHAFRVQSVWAIGDAPERGVKCPIRIPEQTVVCNGQPSPGWYRASHLFGYCTAEWPEGARPPVSDIAAVHKPIDNTCDCWTSKLPRQSDILRIGRFGSWDKGAYSHDGYYKVKEYIES